MGLQAPDPDLLAAHRGQRVVTPSGFVLDGALDRFPAPPVSSPAEDGDGDGVVNEVDPSVVDYLEFYLLNYFTPGTYQQTERTRQGRRLMERIGCTTCHIPDLVLARDRRVAAVETSYDPQRGVFNNLFATVMPLFRTFDDGSGHPQRKVAAHKPSVVKDIFTDFKRHDLGPNFWERNFDGTLTKAFMTEPLWGVGSTAPYGHNGRYVTLEEVIKSHDGEAREARQAFMALSATRQQWIIAFLHTLILFGPPDTASTLEAGNPSHPDFPQRGHGSINLRGLFNDPSDPE
jgi:hypothetical protein